MTRTLRGRACAFALLFFALLSAMMQAQTAPPTPGNPDADMAALQTRLAALKLQKQVDALTAQQKGLEKQVRLNPAPTSTDEQMTAAQNQMKILQIAKQIEGLKAQQAALFNPPAPLAPSAPATPTAGAQSAQTKPLSPEDAEILRLEQERQRLLKEQEIARLKKQNAELNGPPTSPASPAQPPSNCTPQQGPKVAVKVPKKASAWACQHIGVCPDDKPVVVNSGNGCPAGTAGQPTKQ